FMNPAAEMLFAVSASRFIGHPAQEVLIDRELSTALKQVLVSGTPITERELVLDLGYRPRATVDLTAIPLIDSEGKEALLIEMNQVDRQLRITREEGLL
ncbi:MAG: PAS domain-containing protein, partial [Gammaproteobacteria bacterium]|nr:PAS domain-containing protein [Gammaproteobacteria bacterium]NIR92570.1 PAS domain-containing protein [Gammaproteobacteria bacterium]NIW46413.1 PAS domain-containing protein [Gammaproteobacteria bacterium]